MRCKALWANNYPSVCESFRDGCQNCIWRQNCKRKFRGQKLLGQFSNFLAFLVRSAKRFQTVSENFTAGLFTKNVRDKIIDGILLEKFMVFWDFEGINTIWGIIWQICQNFFLRVHRNNFKQAYKVSLTIRFKYFAPCQQQTLGLWSRVFGTFSEIHFLCQYKHISGTDIFQVFQVETYFYPWRARFCSFKSSRRQKICINNNNGLG